MDCDLALDKEFYEGYHSLTFRASKDKNSALQGGVIVDKFACSFDILPTILQLTGYNYNLNLYQGVSMFSDERAYSFPRIKYAVHEYYVFRRHYGLCRRRRRQLDAVRL